MSNPLDLADRIARKAAQALAPLDLEMGSWDPELRKIMWRAVADTATAYANETKPK